MKKLKENDNKKDSYNSDITPEDLKTLGKKGLGMDTGDDRMLKARQDNIDFAGKNLDVPGRNKINITSSSGIVDEENTLFGQGGESKENLEEPKRANTANQ